MSATAARTVRPGAPTQEQLAALKNPFALLISRYQRDPVSFVREVLGAEPDPWQFTVLTALQRGHRRLSIRSGHGVGKLHGMSTLVPTPEGERRWGDLQPGDRLFGRDGEPTHIVARHDHGLQPLYRVTFDDGTSCRVGADHLWTVRGRAQRRIDSKRLYRKGAGRSERPSGYADDFITLSTAELITRGVKRPNGAALARQWELPPHGAAQYPPRDVPLAPYLLGAALADGSLTRSGSLVLTGSAEKAACWQEQIAAAGVEARVWQQGADRWSVRLHGQADVRRKLGLSVVHSAARTVPFQYRENSPAVRLAVLQGLMDADGYCDDRGIAIYTSVSKSLAEDVAWLVRSLGGKAFMGDAQPSHYRKDDKRVRTQDHYDVTVRLPPGMELFTLPSKAKRMRPCQPRYLTRWIESIEPDGEEDAMCVTVDRPDGLYLANDFIVTHNSCLLAFVLLWFMLTRFPLKAVVTAPSAPQLYDALWAELRAWAAKLPPRWLELLEITSDRMALRGHPDEAFISARTSRAESPESLQGVHSEHVLLVIDEASGVPEKVFDAAGGSMSTPGAITICCGNPTRSNGFFWRTQTLERDRWFTMRVSSLDSPRVDPQFATEVAERRGIDSNEYRIRVLGEFPLADSDTLISAELVEQAMQRAVETDWSVPEVWGVDVARFGTDQSVLIKRRGAVVRDPPLRWAGLDTMRVTGEIMHQWHTTAIQNRPAVVVVDSIGIGAGVADRLRELKVPVQDVNVAETPAAAGRYVRMRDELWQAAADWLGTRTVALPYDEMLRDDLCSAKYGFTSDGRLRVESKLEMRSRGLRSPDSADAVCLTFTSGAVLAMASANSSWRGALRRNIRGIV